MINLTEKANDTNTSTEQIAVDKAFSITVNNTSIISILDLAYENRTESQNIEIKNLTDTIANQVT